MPPPLNWSKMEAEEGDITLIRWSQDAPEPNMTDSIFKSVPICSPDLDLSMMITIKKWMTAQTGIIKPGLYSLKNKETIGESSFIFPPIRKTRRVVWREGR